MIKMQMLGRLGRNAELKTLESGKQVLNFSVCHSRPYKSPTGEQLQETVWVECAKWFNHGESAGIAPFLLSGTMVYVEGQPSAKAYLAADQTTRANLCLNVFLIELAGGARQEGSNATQHPQQAPATHQPAQTYTPPIHPQQQQGFSNPAADDLPF